MVHSGTVGLGALLSSCHAPAKYFLFVRSCYRRIPQALGDWRRILAYLWPLVPTPSPALLNTCKVPQEALLTHYIWEVFISYLSQRYKPVPFTRCDGCASMLDFCHRCRDRTACPTCYESYVSVDGSYWGCDNCFDDICGFGY